MKISLRISLFLNGIFLLALLFTVALMLWHAWEAEEYRDGRFRGPTVVLTREIPVYPPTGDGPVFTLPRGVTLQESTPRGVATLGKGAAREYLLLLQVKDSHVSADTQPQASWMNPYQIGPVN